LIITPTFTSGFDTNFGANATAAKAGWNAAAKVFTDAFSDPIHINITVDAVTTAGVFGESSMGTVSVSYAVLHDEVVAHATTENDGIAIGPDGSVPASDPSNKGTWKLTRAQAKALGVIPDDMSNDGGTTFGVTGDPFTFSGPIAANTFDFQGICAHEISEVMGRIGGAQLGGGNTFSLIDIFSFTGAGMRSMGGGAGNFFSIDNGVTLLKKFNDSVANGGDTRDWAAGTNDAFNDVSFSSVVNGVSAVDLQLMDVLGYRLANAPGDLVETVGHISFLRAHDLGTGFGKAPNFLDVEVVVLLAEQPQLALGFQLRADANEPTRTEMFDLLRSAFIAGRPVRLDYQTVGPSAGEIIRVANA
jgi:hypothetical protein